jgi:hypothetical protein
VAKLKVIAPNPKDPDWKFPYASRNAVENARHYFESFQTGGHPAGWHQLRHYAVIKKPKVPFESVPEKFRAKAKAWFEMKLREEFAKKIPGWPTVGKIRSLRMNATYYGRILLTGKRRANRSVYEKRKKIWLAYQEWEKRQHFVDVEASRPHTSHKLLEI